MIKRKLFIIFSFFLLTIVALPSCGSGRPAGQYNTVEATEKARAKERKQAEKIAKKNQKQAKKEFWSLQSKEARKRVKATEKRHKKEARKKKRQRKVF